MAEKLIVQFPLRLSDDLLGDLKKLAALDDRSVSDYIRRALEQHVYGRVWILGDAEKVGKENRASQCNHRENGIEERE